jgi:hypothetical protein
VALRHDSRRQKEDELRRWFTCGGAALLAWSAACATKAPRAADLIAGIPQEQQRIANRVQWGPEWPFVVDSGTLACLSGAVVFRAGGVIYALNDPAHARGFADVAPIRELQSSGPPSHPLKRLVQDQRERVFTELMTCEQSPRAGSSGDTALCEQHIREAYKLTESELQLIEAEGQERFWPPVSRTLKSIGPLAEEGLTLCPK